MLPQSFTLYGLYPPLFFLKLDHFVKSVIFTIENPKRILDKQFFAPQMPDFAAPHAMMAATSVILSRTHAILALTWYCHFSMCL